MARYLSKAAVIIDLHERGFTEDFNVVGDRILWVQRKFFLKPKDCRLVEAHSFIGSDGSEQLILGASFFSHFVDGILIWHFEHASQWRPALIRNKIEELLIKVPVSGSDVNWSEFEALHFQ